MENVLLHPFKTKHGTAPFDKIKLNDYHPAITAAIEKARANITAIKKINATPNFENTIEALEFSSVDLEIVSAIFFNLNSAETSPEMQGLAQELSPMITAFSNDISLDQQLFEKVKYVYDHTDENTLNQEKFMLLKKHYDSFVRNGAMLESKQKERLREIDSALAKLSLTFNENVLAETQDFQLHITQEGHLSGLPEFVREAAKEEAEKRELEGWVFTLDYPSYVPFMTYADNRDSRKKMALAFGAKAFRGNAHDNRETVQQIVTLRHERAQLLGFDNHATYVLQKRMAKNPRTVRKFLNDLLEKAMPAAQKEFQQLSKFAKDQDGIEQLEKWDGAYYTEKLKKALFELDDEALKPYFSLDNVIGGVFEIAQRLFGLVFKQVADIPVYHEEVKTYEAYDESGRFIAVFYADFHPRKGKRAGAWMTSFKNQFIKDGENCRPHVAIVCNFTRPTSSKPSLLTFNEVTTLFHEFGHALHGMLADTTYPSLSGTNVYWDFVELPSQLMENWCYEAEALSIFAKHYETGEVIPMEYIERIKTSANFMEGMATARQLSFGLLDMAYHDNAKVNLADIKSFESSTMAATNLYPDVAENMMSTQFAHIFAGGYSAGYYSYKWAEVLDADAFAYFEENGIFNSSVAKKLQSTVLSKGGTIHPMELYKTFRGKEPNNEALLRRAGLLEK
jgi:Zn-dependent oligopeptidase